MGRKSLYPPSVQPGIPKLERIPRGWRKVPFGDVLEVVTTPARIEDDKKYQLVNAKRSRGGIVARDVKLGRDIKTKTQFFVSKGQFLISRRQIIHGACGIVPAELDGALVSNEYTSFESKDGLILDFLNWYSHSVHFQQTCFHSSIGVDVEKMVFRLRDWLQEPLALPPISEQKRISKILNIWDAATKTLERLIDVKMKLKLGLIQQLLSGKNRFPGFKEPWRKRRLGDLASINSGGTPPSSNPAYFGGSIPWVSIADMTHAGKTLSRTERTLTQSGLKNSAAQMFPAGTVLYAMYASIGECCIADTPLCTSQAILGIRPHDEITNQFLFYFLSSLKPMVKAMGQKGTQANLNAGMVRDFFINVPPLPEQDRISAALSSVDSELACLEKQKWRILVQISGLMRNLFTGRVRVGALS